jgi:uncharacterized membrane protein YgcG
VRCPHCSNPIAPQKAFCERCGFSDSHLATYLGTEWVRLERITDAAHCLRLEETRQLEIHLDDFERQFPQSFLALYLGALPAKLNPLELGMWLLNHGAFSTHQFAKRNDFGAVCVIDPVAGSHGIALGYSLEPLLPTSQIETLLADMVTPLRVSHWSEAAELVIHHLSTALREQGKVSHRRIEALPPPSRGSSPADFGLAPLRTGHRRIDPERNLSRRP